MEVTPLFLLLFISKVYAFEIELVNEVSDTVREEISNRQCAQKNGVIEKTVDGIKKRIISIDRFITETTIAEIRKQGIPLSERKVSK